MMKAYSFGAVLAVGGVLLVPEGRTWLAADSNRDVRLVSQVEALNRTITELQHRIAILERAASGPSPQGGQKVVAPFEVVDGSGKSLLLVTSEKIQAVGATRLTGSLHVASPSGTVIADFGDKGRSIAAPFEVGAGAGTPVLMVTDQPILSATHLGRVLIGRGTTNNFFVRVLAANSHLVAQMGETKEGVGSLDVYDADGKLRADVYGKNGLNVYGTGEKPVITLAPDPERGNAGSVNIWSPAGKVLATMTAHPKDPNAGAVSVMNSAGIPVAGLTTGTGGGAVVVTNSGGVGLAQMSVSDGRGLFQVFARTTGGLPVAVMTQATEHDGGLLQISNAGTPVANLTVGNLGAGYLQLNDPAGNPTVEAGTLAEGNGQVRVGPLYQCLPATLSGPITLVPTCIMGGLTKKK